MTDDKFLWSRKTIQQKLDVSRNTAFRLTCKPDFPKPIILGRSVRWKAEDVVRYVENNA